MNIKVRFFSTNRPARLKNAAGRLGVLFLLALISGLPVISLAQTVTSFSPASGAPGTSVVVNGNNFSGATVLKFNQTDAIFEILSNTQILTTVPAGALSGPIAVQKAGSQSTPSAASFLVAPRITGFSTTSSGVGKPVIIDGANFIQGMTVEFNGIDASPVSVTADSQLSVTVPPEATTGPVTVSTTAGTATSAQDFVVSTAPVITGFSPTVAAYGKPVIIEGANFVPSQTTVKFNGTDAPGVVFRVEGGTQLEVSVPNNATTGPISVTTPDGTVTSSMDFVTGPDPIITGFTPAVGGANTQVTITGINFGNGPTVWVQFNNGTATAGSVTGQDTQIQVTVPNGATTGKIKVTNANGSGTSTEDFLAGPEPIITDFSPASGAPGTSVVINGANFTAGSVVKFNGVVASWNPSASTQIHATVPNAPSGPGPITISNANGTGTGPEDFIVTGTAPFILGFSPDAGPIGTVVQIEGFNFLGASSVKFNGVSSSFQVTSVTGTNTLTATVPSGATTGFIEITRSSGTGTSTDLFFVWPKITGFNPVGGVADNEVTVSGTSLTGATAVRFNGVDAPFTVNSGTTLTAVLPDSTITGPITLVTPAGLVTTRTNFHVRPLVRQLQPATGPGGTPFSIHGAGFFNVTDVQFNGASVSFTVPSVNEIRATVPNDAISGPVRVTTVEGAASSAGDFLVPPGITGFSPLRGGEAVVVTISGTSLQNATQVRLNGASVPFSNISPVEVRATIPAGASSGFFEITTAAGTAASEAEFQVTPAVTGFTPASGIAGTEVAIEGEHFIDVLTVEFNEVAATFVVDSETGLRVTVPDEAVSGPIRVTTVEGSSRSASDFLVEPAIASFEPASGALGETVVVKGTGFSEVETVEFNGASAVFEVIDSRTIHAVVPLDATSGPLQVTTSAGAAQTAGAFAVLPPVIAGFEPGSGTVGSSITISGSAFTGASLVQFGGASADFEVNSPTQITAIVPATATTAPIRVTSPAGVALSGDNFKVLPLVLAFSPENGRYTTEVIVTGTGFSGTTNVQFNGASASFVLANPSQLTATVPAEATTGPIRVSTPGGTALSDANFVVNPPVIDEFSPTSGIAGTVVTISGGNLIEVTEVLFNGVPAEFTANSPEEIEATVPVDASTGFITVVTPAGSPRSSSAFVVEPLGIDDFSPRQGITGTTVTLSGTNFISISEVRVNGVPMEFTVESSHRKIHAIVPANATSGLIQVTAAAGSAQSSEPFVVLPRITGFSPESGPDGTEVTILGSGFFEVSRVQFNADAAFTVTSLNEIKATVPANASSGMIRVTTAAGTALSATEFTVVPAISGFEPTAGTAGQTVVIRGVNFSRATAVRFNGAAASFTIDSPGQISAVLPGNATSGTIRISMQEGDIIGAHFRVLPKVTSFTPAHGAVGTEVTIDGSGFFNVIGVEFNGTNAVHEPPSSVNRLRATVPAEARSGRLRIITAEGDAESQSDFIVTTDGGLSLAHSTASPSAFLGEPFVYTLVASNHTAAAVSGVWLTNVLSENVSFLSASPEISETEGRRLIFNLGILAANEAVSLEITVLPEQLGPATNEALITEASGSLVLNAITTDIQPPRLEFERAGNLLVVTWPVAAAGFALEFANALANGNGWDEATEPIVEQDGRNRVEVEISGGVRYFRLRRD